MYSQTGDSSIIYYTDYYITQWAV